MIRDRTGLVLKLKGWQAAINLGLKETKREREREGKKERRKEERNKKENYSKTEDNLCHLSAGNNGQDIVNLLLIPVKTKT